MRIDNAELEVLLPVHNEGDGIEKVLREIHNIFNPMLRYQFVICEDGSKDNTKDILRELDCELPMALVLSDQRKGYSKAVKDGMALVSAPYLLCLDSDGQCNPADFLEFWALKKEYDVLIGHRTKRGDPLWRIISSHIFQIVYKMFFNVPVHDPSCPFVLAKREVIERISKEMGEMNQGFWWEFTARVYRRGYTLHEIPINHRNRLAGKTQVYRFSKVPMIGINHFLALFRIFEQTKY